MSSLEHHGIKGQKWGVRRFQNPDGTRTDKGKKQEKLRRLKKTTSEDFVSIRKTLSDDDLRMLNYSDSEIKYMRKNGSLNRDPITSITAHRVIQKDKNGTPVTYVEGTGFTADSLLTGKAAARIISIDLATRSGEEYRGKGYAVAAGKKMVKWFDRYGYKEYEYMEWAAKEKNIASQKTAEKLGFNKLDIAEPGWTLYTYAKHSLLGGNMNYIYGNTLVLGDSSYLEHHGIKGQRWGVRRFQNKDGSLTNAGRKRLGYSTKDVKKAVVKGGKAVGGAVAIVGKTGYKLGKKAVVAAKARSDRKKAEKLEKKKEKASKTRVGVIANSDLFTAKEMEELNKKFKMQDEMTIASLKKGADIVTNIATIARGVNDINSAVENVTGKSLNPFKNASNETKRQKEAAELEQARQNAKKAASQAENEATKAEKAAYEFNKQKDHDKEKAAEKEAKKQQGKSTNDNKSDDDDKPKPPTGDKPKSPDDGGGKGKSADNSPNIPVVPVEYDKSESSGSNKNRTHTVSPEQQKKLVAFKMNKTKGPNDPGDVSDEDVAKYKQAAKDADQRAKSAQDNANNIKIQRDQLDAAIRNYKLPPQQDPNYDAALSQLRAASNRSSELTSAYKKAQSEADTAKVNAYRAQREAVASEYGGSKGKNIAKDMAKRMSDASYQHEVDAIDNQRDSNKSAYDRNVAKEYIKDVLNPKKAINRKIDQVASKIADKAVNQQKEALAKERDRSRKQMSSNFEQAMKSGTLDADKAIREYYQREFNLHGAQLDKAVDNYMNAMSKRKTYRRAASHSAINLDSQALVHYGIKGQRWGMRRFQNPDGTRTTAGKARYSKSNTELSGGGGGVPEDEDDKAKSIADALGMDVDDYRKKVDNSPLGYKHAADKLDADAKKLHEQAEANRRMADQAKSSGYKDKAREFERNAEKCEKQAKSKEGLRDYCQWRADGGTVTKAAADTINQTLDATKNAVGRAFDATANTVHDLNPGNYSIENKRGRIKIHKKPYVSKFAHGLLIDEDGTLYLEHHGIKGQRWGVRRFQNPDGTLTDKGRKHYQKKLDLEDRKLTAAKAAQGRYERVRTPMSVGMAVIGAIAGGLAGSPAGPAGIAAGAAFVSAISGGSTYAEYTVKGIFAGHGANRSKQKIAKYKDMLKQDAFSVEDGTLYLEHFGIKNMKWGVRRFQNKDGSLTEAGRKRYGSGNEGEELSGGGGGGGAPEEDEEMKKKIEEAAKKAGMTVAEYRKKMGSKLYDMFGGKYKKEAEDLRKLQAESSKNARLLEKEGGKKNEDANSERVNAKTYGHYAQEANKSYEKSIVGKYDKLKATMAERGKAKSASQTPGRTTAPSKKENAIARASVAAKAAGRVASDVASGKSRPKSAKKVYGDYKNRVDVATMQALGKIRSDDEKTMKDGMYKNRQWRARADYAEKRGDKKTAEKYRKMSDDELNRSDYADKEKDIVDMMGDAVYKNYMLRNKKHADNARSARTEQWRNRVAGDRAERQMNTSGAKIKTKLKSGQLPVAEAGQYASAARDRVKAKVSGKLATRKYNKSVNAMGEALASGAKDYINTPKVKKKLTKDQIAANRPVSREKNVKAGKGQVKVGDKHESYAVVNQRRDRRKPMATHDITLLADHSNEPRTHVLPKMKSATATAKPMRKLTSKELAKIRSEARIKQLKKDGDYTGEYKKKRRK